MKFGFLIIDMQAAHLQGIDKNIVDRACEYINYVSDKARSKDHLVIHVQDIEGMTEFNRDEYNTIPDIQVSDKDLIVTKEFSNSFWKTELEQILRDQGIEFIILSGTAAEHCILATYNGAIERGFNAVILQNGILSKHVEAISSTYRDRNIISYPVIKYL